MQCQQHTTKALLQAACAATIGCCAHRQHPMYVSAVEKSADATTKATSTRLPYLLLLPPLLKLPMPSLLQALLQDWAVPLLQLLQLSLAVPSAV